MNGILVRQLLKLACATLAILVTKFVIKLYRVRSFIRGIQKQGLVRSHHPSGGQQPIFSRCEC